MDETSNATVWNNYRTVSKPTYIHHFRFFGGNSKGEMEKSTGNPTPHPLRMLLMETDSKDSLW